MNIDREFSCQIAKLIGARRGQCWENVRRAIAHPLLGGSHYVEGWVVVAEGYVLDHGWIEHEGRIIDPTRWREDVTYFPGLRLTLAELIMAIGEGGGSPFTRAIGHDHVDHWEHLKAYASALALAHQKMSYKLEEPEV